MLSAGHDLSFLKISKATGRRHCSDGSKTTTGTETNSASEIFLMDRTGARTQEPVDNSEVTDSTKLHTITKCPIRQSEVHGRCGNVGDVATRLNILLRGCGFQSTI